MSTPYRQQGRHQFWATAASGWPEAPDITRLYSPKFDLGIPDGARIATAGSCFAQNIRRELIARKVNYFDAEPGPAMLAQDHHAKFSFGLFSARYGNIYTAAQLRQLAERAFDVRAFEETIWETDGRFYDVFRPTVEPDGFISAEEVGFCRASHLRAVRRLFEETDVFIFTLGLTEAWRARADGLVYPLCPGTAAGRFDAEKHAFINYGVADVVADFEAFMHIVRGVNPDIKFILTVSPVPLVATASSQHVINANSLSKAVLRSAAGDLYARHDNIDYFPSYEIFTTPLSGAQFYAADKRNPTDAGIRLAMDLFFSEHGEGSAEMLVKVEDPVARAARENAEAIAAKQQEICDEILLANEQSDT